jgi:hypothetical protein
MTSNNLTSGKCRIGCDGWLIGGSTGEVMDAVPSGSKASGSAAAGAGCIWAVSLEVAVARGA